MKSLWRLYGDVAPALELADVAQELDRIAESPQTADEKMAGCPYALCVEAGSRNVALLPGPFEIAQHHPAVPAIDNMLSGVFTLEQRALEATQSLHDPALFE